MKTPSFLCVVATVLLANTALAHEPSTDLLKGADPQGRADSTQAFRNAIAAIPKGTIRVPSGTFLITTTLTLNRNQELAGDGSTASTLSCAMRDTPCLVVADTAGGPNNYGITNLHDFSLSGNGGIGVYLGGDPNGKYSKAAAFADFVNLVSVRITGFHTALMFGNNAFVNKLERCAIFGNNQGIYVPEGLSNTGEAESISNSSIFNNQAFGMNLRGNGEWFISGTSFDYNGEAALWTGSIMYFSQCHFEEQTAPVLTIASGANQLSIRDSEFLIQSKSGHASDILDFYPQQLSLTISHTVFFSNYPIPALMRFQGNVIGSISDITASNITALGNVAYSNPYFLTANTPWTTGLNAGRLRLMPVKFASLEHCTPLIDGTLAALKDSSSQTWGSIAQGGGAYVSMVFCDGTNWTVAGK